MYRLVKLVTNTQGVSSEFINPFGTEKRRKFFECHRNRDIVHGGLYQLFGL